MNSPTPYSEVNGILDALLSNVRAVLGDYFVGMYLYGSLASGDFNPLTSDIDFVAVTTTELPADKIALIETFHQHFAAGRSTWAANKWTTKLEGVYISQTALRRHNPNGLRFPMLSEGQFCLSELGSDWIIQRHVIRTWPVTIAGPDPKSLIDVVSPDDLRGAIGGIMREWWTPMVDNPQWLKETGYLAFAVLTMCRVLHGLTHGSIASKPSAARWTKETYPQWVDLIDWALIQTDDVQHERLPEVLDFIQFAVDKDANQSRA